MMPQQGNKSARETKEAQELREGMERIRAVQREDAAMRQQEVDQTKAQLGGCCFWVALPVGALLFLYVAVKVVKRAWKP